MTEPLMTPYEVERKLLAIAEAQDEATHDLVEAEAAWIMSKQKLDLALARARARISDDPALSKWTVQRKADQAVLDCEKERIQADADEIWVRGTRAQIANLKSQEDLTRSLGVSIRASMDLS